jgi:hypothetical protein
MTRGVAQHGQSFGSSSASLPRRIDPGCVRRIAHMSEWQATAGQGRTEENAPSVTVTPDSRYDRRGGATDTSSEDSFATTTLLPSDVTAIKMLQVTVANLLVALGEAAANQRHVESKRLPGRGDWAVVAIYAQLVIVVWGVRRDGHDLYEVERGRGQH